MSEPVTTAQPDAHESVWIEIIRHMERIYAQLAQAQAEGERHAQELSEAKELADNVIRSMHDSLVVLDSAGRITLVNDAAERLFGHARADLLGRGLDALVPPDARERWAWTQLRQVIREEVGLAEVEATWCSRDGRSIPVGVSGAALRDRWGEPMGAVLVVRDLTETKRRIAEARAATRAARAKARELEKANADLTRLQAELVQAAKMSSLGRLAAGVAHELNNPLGSVLLYSDLVLEDTPAGDPRRANLTKIAQQAARCRQIVRDLLDFARAPTGTRTAVDINRLLRDAVGMLEGHEIFHNVAVTWDLADALPPVAGDPGELHQALTNIILNAVEAMAGTGQLTVRTESAPEAGTVVIRVSDTGCGIAPEHREKLFEPFFTTKEDGTGLGLAITYRIIERHGGEIEVVSEVGEGTTFVLTLRSSEEAGRDG